MLPKVSADTLSWTNARNALNLQQFYAVGGRRSRGAQWRAVQNPYVPLRHWQRVFCFTWSAFQDFDAVYRENSSLVHWSVFLPQRLRAVLPDNYSSVGEELFILFLPNSRRATRLRIETVNGQSTQDQQQLFVHLLNLVNDVPESHWQTIATFHTLALKHPRFWGYVAYYNGDAVGALGAFRTGNTVGLYSGFTVPEWRGRGLSLDFADEVVRSLHNKGFHVICQCRPDLERFYAKVSAIVTARWGRWDL